jgi:hypothetical protein
MKLLLCVCLFSLSCFAQDAPTKFFSQNYSSTAQVRFGPLSQFFQIMPPQVQVMIFPPGQQDGVVYKITISYVDSTGAKQQKISFCPQSAIPESQGSTVCSVLMDQPVVTVAVDIMKGSGPAVQLN